MQTVRTKSFLDWLHKSHDYMVGYPRELDEIRIPNQVGKKDANWQWPAAQCGANIYETRQPSLYDLGVSTYSEQAFWGTRSNLVTEF